MENQHGEIYDILSIFEYLNNLSGSIGQLRFKDASHKTELSLELLRVYSEILRDTSALMAAQSSKTVVKSGVLGQYGSNLRAFIADFLYSNNGVRLQWIFSSLSPVNKVYESETTMQLMHELLAVLSAIFDCCRLLNPTEAHVELLFMEPSNWRSLPHLSIVATFMNCPIGSGKLFSL